MRKEKTFKCRLCFKAFGHKGSLNKHITTVHGGIKKFNCELCNKAFGL